MQSFQELSLPEPLLNALEKLNFHTPTPIQAQAIPVALEGKDILGSAQTGTGKTAAFGIPLVAQLMENPHMTALVMTPTRELAAQVMTQLQALLGKKTKIATALLIGGEPMPKQLRQLRYHPRLVVGTPGRINDHLQRKTLHLKKAGFLVLDETDRMLDMGFSIQIENVLEHLPEDRQTLLFSATLPKSIIHIAEKYLNDHTRIAVCNESAPAANVKQDTLHIKEGDKHDELLKQLDERDGTIIIFVKTKFGTEKMATKLSKEGHQARAIHGDLRQGKRNRIIDAYRKQKYRILVATDVAARGLDIPHIEHVINFDLPQCPEDYIHRIGRTARAGAKGFALNFVSRADGRKWHAIERMLNPDAHPEKERDSRPSKPRGKRRSFFEQRKRFQKPHARKRSSNTYSKVIKK